jgi:hypothetical protein
MFIEVKMKANLGILYSNKASSKSTKRNNSLKDCLVDYFSVYYVNGLTYGTG